MITMSGDKVYNADLYLRLSREVLETNITNGEVVNISEDYERERQSGSITTQKAFLKSFCEENGINIHNIYADDGFSGANFERPGWKKLIEDVENEKINMVIVKDLSRLGRVSSKVTYYTDEYFPAKRIRFIAVADAIDTGIQDTSGDEMAQFKAFFNEWFLRDCSKKVRAGKKTRAKEGKVMTTYATYGYKKDPLDKNHYLIDEDIAPIVKEIFQLAREGMTPNAISKIMTDKKYKVPSDVVGNTHTRSATEIKRGWNRNAIKRILVNPVYLGNVVSGKLRKISYKSKKIIGMPKEDWIIVKNQHEPLVDKETFDLVQQLIKSRTRTRKQRHEWLLSGFLYCKECGKKISIFNPKGDDVFFTKCNTYSANTALHLCTPHTNKVSSITDAILNNIRGTCEIFLKNQVEKYSKLAKNEYKKYENSKDTIQKEISAYERKILIIDKKIDNLYEDKIDGKIRPDDFERIYNNAISEKESIKNKIEELQESLKSNETSVDFDKIVSDFVSLKNITRPILVQLVDKITVDKDKNIKIYYKFNVLDEVAGTKEEDVIKINNSKKFLKVS